MHETPVFTGFRSAFMFAIRYHHTERGERCKAKKRSIRLFFAGFFNFPHHAAIDAPPQALLHPVAASQVDW